MPFYGVPSQFSISGGKVPLFTPTVRPIQATDYLDSIANDTYFAGTPGVDGHWVNRPSRNGMLKGTFDGALPFNIHATSTYNGAGTLPQFPVFIDGSFLQDIVPASFNTGLTINAAAGLHTYEIWAGQQSKPSTNVLGNWVACLEGASVTVSTVQAASSTFICLGDSIAGGGNCSDPSRLGFLGRIRGDFPGRVVDIGYGVLELGNQTAATWAAQIAAAAALSGAIKIFVLLQAGTNDYAVAPGQSASDYGIQLGALCDDIHALLPTATILVMEILARSSQGPNSFGDPLSAYQTQQSNVAAARPSFCVYIPNTSYGLSAPGGASYDADGLHLTDLGQSQVHTGLIPFYS